MCSTRFLSIRRSYRRENPTGDYRRTFVVPPGFLAGVAAAPCCASNGFYSAFSVWVNGSADRPVDWARGSRPSSTSPAPCPAPASTCSLVRAHQLVLSQLSGGPGHVVAIRNCPRCHPALATRGLCFDDVFLSTPATTPWNRAGRLRVDSGAGARVTIGEIGVEAAAGQTVTIGGIEPFGRPSAH